MTRRTSARSSVEVPKGGASELPRLDKARALCCIAQVKTKVAEVPDRSPVDPAPGAPRKTVGRRRPGTTLDIEHDTKEDARAWRRAFPTPFVPKGVYRFRSHEEADDWLWKMITRKG
jgi:hypothetical protein